MKPSLAGRQADVKAMLVKADRSVREVAVKRRFELIAALLDEELIQALRLVAWGELEDHASLANLLVMEGAKRLAKRVAEERAR